MKRRQLIITLVAIPLIALVWWIASNTSWTDVQIPMPLRGEARRNPFYAAQRLAEKLGAQTTLDRSLVVPPPDALIVATAWNWNLTRGRREALERWVEAGGRLVVDSRMVGGEAEFEEWSGIFLEHHVVDTSLDADDSTPDMCRSLVESHGPATSGERASYVLCNANAESFLLPHRRFDWGLADKFGIQATRVPVGRGSVTVINATAFSYLNLFDGDHGRIFVAATELRRGDNVHFLTEDNHPPLLSLIWQYGAPVVVLALVAIAFALWRGGVRFGPLAAPQDPTRRSLAEQIRGTGQFALRHGDGDSLHSAVVRALDEDARRRIPSYTYLSAKERATAVARLAGFDWNAIASAVHNPRSTRSHELRSALSLLETARRALVERTRSDHGRH